MNEKNASPGVTHATGDGGAAIEALAGDVLARLAAGLQGSTVRYVGDYELEGEIARGGMGVVFRARQKSLGRSVALKMILSGRFASDEVVRRFRAEAEAAATLQHPGIVTIHEVGVHEGHHYFSMDLVEGRSLERIGNGAPIAARRAAQIALEIARAAQCAHERGILHRDLKPSNVLLDERGCVRVTDFGLAKRFEVVGDPTRPGQVMGTPGYMSPEQAGGHSVGPASDVFSIGAILYELVTGRSPFAAETPLATLMQLRDTEPVRPRSLNPRLPRDLENVCMKALEKSVERRYASAAELAGDLERFLAREPVRARPATLLLRISSWTERHPWHVAAAAALGAALLACLAVGLYAQVRYLEWIVAHPGTTPEPRPAPRVLELGRDYWILLALLATSWIGPDIVRRSSGLTFHQFRDTRIPKVLGHRTLSTTRLSVYGVVLALALLYVAWTTAWRIESMVWNGAIDARIVLDVTLVVVMVLGLLSVAREARASLHGIPPRTYTIEESMGHVDQLAVRITDLLRAGKTNEALELCELLRSLYPEQPEWMELRARVHEEKGESGEAARLYRAAAEQARSLGEYTPEFIADLERRGRELDRDEEKS